MSRPDARVVAAELARRIDELVPWLGLAPLHKINNAWQPLNSMRGDRRPGSFVIYGRGHAKAGGWVDYADPERLRGDALDLCAYMFSGNPRDRKLGYAQALRFLGWEGAEALTLAHQRERRAALEADRERAERRAANELDENRRRAFGRWLHDQKLEQSTLAWRYLAARGIDLARMEKERRLPGAIRQRDKDFHRESKRELATMTALITGLDDKPRAVHRTFLGADGVKANVDPARKIWPGKFWGGAIRLSKGDGNLTPAQAAKIGARQVLAIGEGIETCLSVALAVPAWRVWAAGALGAIGAVELPACARCVVLLKDNDEAQREEAEARAQASAAWSRTLRAAAERAKAAGLPLYVATPKRGAKDWNDALQEMGAL